MSYLVFARKFRPQTFDEVVGQEPIMTTLKNSIRQGRVPQNFIFAGQRGIGKTSTARILAKALNCAKGPTETPCGKCTACLEITEGNSLDVLEIDGASNRGIDEIRNLRETVKFKPASGRVKIYIIDEVHMLTLEAFNALLKTLEEPPGHVKFVFATTEFHKVPLTILSRCHRFTFRRIPIQEIAAKLEEIAKAEKLKFEKNAIFLIAKTSEGSLRDAEGLLDQLASFSEDEIKEADVLQMLGLTAEEVYFSVLSALKAADAHKIFEVVSGLYEGGRDLFQFAKGLLEMFRHLLLLQCAEGVEAFIEMSGEGLEELKKRKEDFSKGELLLALSILGNLQNQLRRNLAPARLLLETSLLKLLHLDGLKNVEEIIHEAGKSGGEPRAAAHELPRAGREEKRDIVTGPGIVRSPSAQTVTGVASASLLTPVASAATLDEIEGLWPRIIEYVKTKRMSTGIFLSESEPVEVEGAKVTLGFPSEFQFHKEMLEKNSNRQLIEEAFEIVSGKKIYLEFAVTKPESQEAGASSSGRPEDSKLPEIINQALNIFEGSKIVKKE